MAKFNGSDFLIKVGDGGGPEVFTTIACMRSTSFSLNNEQIDTTSKCNNQWREMIEGGVRSMSLSLAGIFNDDATMATMIAENNQGAISNYQITSGYGDVYEGAFQATTQERSGEYTDAEQYSMSLESAGEITYTAPP